MKKLFPILFLLNLLDANAQFEQAFDGLNQMSSQFEQKFDGLDQSGVSARQVPPSSSSRTFNGLSQANVFNQRGNLTGTVTVQGEGGNVVNIIDQQGRVTTGVVTDTRTPGTIGGGTYITPIK